MWQAVASSRCSAVGINQLPNGLVAPAQASSSSLPLFPCRSLIAAASRSLRSSKQLGAQLLSMPPRCRSAYHPRSCRLLHPVWQQHELPGKNERRLEGELAS